MFSVQQMIWHAGRNILTYLYIAQNGWAWRRLVFDDVLPAVRSAKQAGMIVYGVFEKYSEHNMEEIKKIADGYLIDFHSAPSPTPVVRKVV